MKPCRTLLCVLAFAFSGCKPAVEDLDAPAEPAEPTATVDVETAVPETEVPHTLKRRLEVAIDQTRSRDLLTTNAFWTVFHGVLAYGPGLTLRVPDSDERVPAVDYMLGGAFAGGEIRGLRFEPKPTGLDVGMGPTYEGQGHRDQFVAILAQMEVPPGHPVFWDGKRYVVRDFVRQIEAHARVGDELSWTIIALGYYAGTEHHWQNAYGEKLHYEDLVRSELQASLDQAACGGTHRLIGLTWALHLHLRSGGQVTGLWQAVADHLAANQKRAREFQNPDGSFSARYFAEPGQTPDLQERLNSSGHTLEWLATSLPDDQLHELWMQRGADAVALMMLEIQNRPMESGALYHAAHGLVLYYERVFGWDYFENQTESLLETDPIDVAHP